MAQQFDLGAIDIGEIDSLMDLLARSDVEECEIEQGERSLTLRRQAREVHDSALPVHSSTPSSAEEEEADDGVLVRSTGVGMFYRSEKRSGEPKVDVGSRVAVGEVLGYVEVMGLAYGLPSTGDGVVDAFLVEDGQPVEYGQPLVTLRPS